MNQRMANIATPTKNKITLAQKLLTSDDTIMISPKNARINPTVNPVKKRCLILFLFNLLFFTNYNKESSKKKAC